MLKRLAGFYLPPTVKDGIIYTSAGVVKEKFKWNKYLSNSLGFVLAATNNYIWNRLWTFQSTSAEIPVEYSKFLIIAIIGLGINNLVIYLLHDKLKLNFYLAKLFAIGVVTLWNFIMNYLFTF